MKIRKVTYTENGVTKNSKKFYAVFADHAGVIRRLPLFESRKASDEAGRKIDKLVDLRAANDTIDPELSRWIESTTPFIRSKLAQFDVITAAKLAGSKSLIEHLSEWEAALLAKNNLDRDVRQKANRVRRLFELCGFKVLVGYLGKQGRAVPG